MKKITETRPSGRRGERVFGSHAGNWHSLLVFEFLGLIIAGVSWASFIFFLSPACTAQQPNPGGRIFITTPVVWAASTRSDYYATRSLTKNIIQRGIKKRIIVPFFFLPPLFPRKYSWPSSSRSLAIVICILPDSLHPCTLLY